MSPESKALAPALYLVATPLGSARDITLRALDILGSADILVAEDTRTLKRLMQIHAVALGERPVLAYHDHNGARMRPKLLSHLREGRSVAYASDAGTPLIADPGYALVREAIAQGFEVTTAPGPSACIAALSVAGLPTDRFFFAGFPPPQAGARRKWIGDLADIPGSLVLYEGPSRVRQTLADLRDGLGGTRNAALCRELTKRFEDVRRGTLESLAAESDAIKGEIVLVIDRDRSQPSAEDMSAALEIALRSLSVKDAAAKVSEELGLARRLVYQAALDMEKRK